MGITTTPLIDPQQLHRIESVHRGFLYQHLYAVAWLLSAQSAGAISIVIERDEDLEITFPNHRIYIQVKTRSTNLTPSDLKSAFQRFDKLRLEHTEKRRHGSASFLVISNIAPGPVLLARLKSDEWPSDVEVHWPDNSGPTDKVPVAPKSDLSKALCQCAEIAASLPYSVLAPETLVWKLAGCVMAAAAGSAPRSDHTFRTEELSNLFEQVIIQLQDFPSPPLIYRPLSDEPPLQSPKRVRIITGYSGSGKTSWVSQAASHTTDIVTYFDVNVSPGPALASALARELAARIFGHTGSRLGEILLPGSTGPEILHRISKMLAENGQNATIVLDNAHLIPPTDIRTLVQQGNQLNFLLLCQPNRNVSELESLLSTIAEPLQGWGNDTIALEVSEKNCRGDYTACQRLANLTAGMPLYVQNAISIAASEYAGSISELCDNLEERTHITETAQELILTHVFDSFPLMDRECIGVLSLSDIPLARSDVKKLLMYSLKKDEKIVALILRQLRSSGCMEVFGGNRLKIHDAMRLIGQAHLEHSENAHNVRVIFTDILAESLRQNWEMQKLSLYLRMLAAVGDIKTLVKMIGDELFHELGVQTEILSFLDKAAASKEYEPEDRFWALDGLVFSDFKQGNFEKTAERLDAMACLIADHSLKIEEILSLSMKRMNLFAIKGDADAVLKEFEGISKLQPETSEHQRIFRYNTANALFHLGNLEFTLSQTSELIQEYYDILGISPVDIVGKNSDKIRPLLKDSKDLDDHLKHLADCLDLHAQAMNTVGRGSPFGRIHAMKFYELAHAHESLIRVGQDLVDEFVARNDFVGARQILETNLFPYTLHLRMLEKFIPIRSQYAVVLAYCGDFKAAEAEMERLAPYEAGLGPTFQLELQKQRKLIAEIRKKGAPPQWLPPGPETRRMQGRKIGRNEPCPCGSGKKYKKCHGKYK